MTQQHNKDRLEILRQAAAKTRAAQSLKTQTPKRKSSKKPSAAEQVKNGAERMTQKETAHAPSTTPNIHQHDPEIAPHLFKKWVGDRVALVRQRHCDNPNCGERGDFRAPKSRHNLENYYWFCLQHVQLYNAAWDYYAGMSVDQIEEAMRASTTWERPTWPLGKNGAERKIEKNVRDAFKRVFDEDDIESQAEKIHAKAQERGVDPRYAAQIHALRELGLAPPIDFDGIKKRYRDLVKINHPDILGGAAEAEEKLKRINSAFTILKMFYDANENAVQQDTHQY